MTPNRIAAVVAVLASVVSGVLIPLLDVIEGAIARAVVLSVLAVCATAVVICWLLGWQKFEERNPRKEAAR